MIGISYISRAEVCIDIDGVPVTLVIDYDSSDPETLELAIATHKQNDAAIMERVMSVVNSFNAGKKPAQQQKFSGNAAPSNGAKPELETHTEPIEDAFFDTTKDGKQYIRVRAGAFKKFGLPCYKEMAGYDYLKEAIEQQSAAALDQVLIEYTNEPGNKSPKGVKIIEKA